MKHISIALFGLLLLLTACLPVASPTDLPPASSTSVVDLGPTIAPATSPTPTAGPQVIELNLWVAPRFAPDPSSDSGRLLAERLADFEANFSNIKVNIRTKADQGPGNLLSALASASQIGPSAIPDVITLDPDGLNQAAAAGLIQSIEPTLTGFSDQERYPFAVQASQVEDQVFGIPFASNARVFSYRTGLYPSTPESWSDLLESSSSFLFAASDPQATFTVAQYLALEGEFTDSEGNPILDPGKLSDVLSFYDSSEFAGRLPLYSLQYESAEETWTALQEKRGGSAEAPLNLFLDQADRDSETAVPIPTRDGTGIALSDTWSLAVTSADPFRLQAVKALLNWLLDPEFQGQWTRSLGMIPADPLAVDYWPDPDAAIIRPIIEITRAAPEEEIFTLFGPIIQQAVEDVLVGNATPEEAALDAIQDLNQE